MELLIWAGGRWRRVCPLSGRVEGWRRRARLVSYRRSALHEVPLAALRSVFKGPRLPKQRIQEVNPIPPAVPDVNPNRYGQTNQAWTPTKLKDACVQTDTESLHNTTALPAPNPIPTDKLQQVKEIQVPSQPERKSRSVSTEKIPIIPSKQQKIDKNKAENTEKQKTQQGDTVKLVNHTDTESSSEEDAYTELIIDERDILLLRKYIETHNTNIDLYRFDADDNYKKFIFYKIQPIVRIERCSRTAKMIKDHDIHNTVQFARQLGLWSVDEIKQIQQRRTRHRAVKQATTYFTKDGLRKVKKPTPEEALISSDEDEEMAKKNANKSRVNRSDGDCDSDIQEQRRIMARNVKRMTKKLSSGESYAEKPREVKGNRHIELTSLSDKEKLSEMKSKATRTNVDSGSDVQVQLRSNKRRNIIEEELTNNNTDGEKLKKIKKTVTQSNDKETNKDKNNSSEQQKNNNAKSKVALKMAAGSNTGNEQANKKKQKSDSSSKNTVRNPSNESNGKNDSDEENQRPEDTKTSGISKRFVMPKRSSVPPGREYSMLEDQAIVAWLSTSTQRERAVNGNRIWRDLQESYPRLTGQNRSWHSLRNRYLRYILPSLGALMLPPHVTQRLRAHATLGELKSRKQFRRNSVFRVPAVRSASARAPRPRLETTTSPRHTATRDETPESGTSTPPSPKRRVLRSSTHTSRTPSDNTRSHSPTKPHTRSPTKPPTQLTRSPTRRRQSQSPAKRKMPGKAPVDSSKSAVNTGRTRSPHKATDRTRSPQKSQEKSRERRSRSPRSSPSYSEVSRRLALRSRSTPQQSPQPTVVPHKRRLYNPQRPASGGPLTPDSCYFAHRADELYFPGSEAATPPPAPPRAASPPPPPPAPAASEDHVPQAPTASRAHSAIGGDQRAPDGLISETPAAISACSRPANTGGSRGLDAFREDLVAFTRYRALRPLATLAYCSDAINYSTIVSTIEFDKDDEFFAIAGVTKRIKVFEFAAVVRDAVDVHYPCAEMACSHKISCVCWNAYHKHVLASSDYEGTVSIWDAHTGVRTRALQEHDKRCWSVHFNHSDVRLLASGSDDSRVKLWALNADRSVTTLDAKYNVCCVRFNPKSACHLAFGSADHCVHYYDLRAPRSPLAVFKDHRKAVSYVKFLDSRTLVSASTDSQLKLWRVDSPRCQRSFTGHANEKNFVGLATDGKYIACGSENNALYVYYSGLSRPLLAYRFDAVRGFLECERRDEEPSEFVSAVCWRKSHDQQVLLAANSQGTIKVLELI